MQLGTAIRSRIMRIMASNRVLQARQSKARLARTLRGQPAAVHYFHQVDDPYSHLAVQKLTDFAANLTLPVIPHLVSPPEAAYQGDHERFAGWAQRDAATVANGFGATLGSGQALTAPAAEQIGNAQQRLATVISQLSTTSPISDFSEPAIEVGEALWNGTPLAPTSNRDTDSSTKSVLAAGDELRAKLGHYQGAMFWFDGEWFWGLDRLHLLEARLAEEGFATSGATPTCPIPTGPFLTAPIPTGKATPNSKDCSNVTLEYFPSLRSPYTAVGHQRVLQLIEQTGVTVRLRPVMPMLMRGIPAPRAKQAYIISDAAREARFYNAPFGNFVDPFGEPVKRAFALFPAAERLGKGMAFTTAYLSAAWANGTDISNDAGLAIVAEAAGLDYATLQQEAAGDDWEAVLTDNVNDMLEAGLWGVPSFRVTGGNGPRATKDYACWGQDRIWRVGEEIVARA